MALRGILFGNAGTNVEAHIAVLLGNTRGRKLGERTRIAIRIEEVDRGPRPSPRLILISSLTPKSSRSVSPTTGGWHRARRD